MTDHARRIAGAMPGLALGLLYGLVSGYINSIVMAGVPLRVDTPAILADAIFAGAGRIGRRVHHGLAAVVAQGYPRGRRGHRALWGGQIADQSGR